MEDDKLESEEKVKNPNLEIAQLKFFLSLPENADNKAKKAELMEIITAENMAPYYQLVCEELGWKIDTKLLEEMEAKNAKALEEFDKEIEYSTDSLSVADVKDAYLNKANYLSKIGDKENTIKALSQAYDKTVSLGYKLDNIFHCIRTGLFFMDTDLIYRNLQRSEKLLEEGADWHSRNCFKIMRGLYSISKRNFPTTTELFVDAISTFVCTELISYDNFIMYTVISAILTLSRSELKRNFINNPDILQALHSNHMLKEYLFSLYESDYKLFFERLADIEVAMRQDMILHTHYRFYIREMRIKAYDQLLSTYISVNLSYMAEQFGVSEDFIENDISKFISAGRLNYKIDKVNDTVVNIPSDAKTEVFKCVLKQGDLLLNRVHKLSRVINI